MALSRCMRLWSSLHSCINAENFGRLLSFVVFSPVAAASILQKYPPVMKYLISDRSIIPAYVATCSVEASIHFLFTVYSFAVFAFKMFMISIESFEQSTAEAIGVHTKKTFDQPLNWSCLISYLHRSWTCYDVLMNIVNELMCYSMLADDANLTYV